MILFLVLWLCLLLRSLSQMPHPLMSLSRHAITYHKNICHGPRYLLSREKHFNISITILWTTRVCTFYVRHAKQSLQGNPPPELWCYNSKSRKPVALDLDSRQPDAFELIVWCNWTSNRKQVALNQESFARNATPRISGAEKLQKSLSSTIHLKGKSL